MIPQGQVYTTPANPISLLWDRFTQLGLHAGLEDHLRRKVTLSNQISFFILLIASTSAIIFQSMHGSSLLVWSIASLNVIPVSVILLNRQKYTAASRMLLSTLFPICMMFLIVLLKIMGSEFGFEVNEYHFYTPRYYMVIVSLLPLFLLDIKEKAPLYAALGVNILCILMFDKAHAWAGVSPEVFGLSFDNYFQATVMPVFIQFFMYAGIITYQRELSDNQVEIESLVSSLEKHNGRFQSEIDLAQKVIERLLPQQLPQIDNITISAYLSWCNEVGGDFYTVRQLKNGKYLIVVADVSGKGLASSIIVSTMHSSIETQLNQKDLDLCTLVLNLNEVLFNTTGGHQFVTSWLAIYDPENQELESVNAGHLPPIIVGKDKSPTTLTKGGPLLGILDQDYPCQVEKVTLKPGDLLCAFTDGVTEAMNADDEMYEMDRVVNFMQRHKNNTPEHITRALRMEVQSFTQKDAFEDDFALLVMKQS